MELRRGGSYTEKRMTQFFPQFGVKELRRDSEECGFGEFVGWVR